MKNKLMLLVGAAVGYVLGARAGRERYDQLADQAAKLWTDPRVQDKVEEVRSRAPEVAHQVGEAAKAKAEEVKAKVTGSEGAGWAGGDDSSSQGNEQDSTASAYENDTGSIDADGNATVDTTGFGPGGDKLP